MPPGDSCTRISQCVQTIDPCPYLLLSKSENVVYARLQPHFDRSARILLTTHQYRHQPGFGSSLTVVLKEPNLSNPSLNWPWGPEKDPEKIEEFRNLPLRFVGFHEYAAKDPDIVVRELGASIP